MQNKIVLSFFFILIIHFAFGQRDPRYVREFHDKLIIKPFLGGPSYTLNLTPDFAPDSVNTSYTSNTYGVVGVDMAYKAFSIGLSKRAGDLSDEKVYGKTKYSSLTARFGFRKFSFEAISRKFKGYADLNTPNYYKELPDSIPYLIRNDISNSYLKVKAVYQFAGSRFSTSAPFTFTERQLKSAACLFGMVYFNTSKLKGDSTIIPYPSKFYYRALNSINNIRVSGIGFAPGFGFTLVFKQAFLSATFFGGLEVQHQKYFLEKSQSWETITRIAPAGDSRVSLGINGNRAFFALTIRNDINNMSLRTFRVQSLYTLGTFDFGYRFNAPKIVSKTYDKSFEFIHRIKSKIFQRNKSGDQLNNP